VLPSDAKLRPQLGHLGDHSFCPPRGGAANTLEMSLPSGANSRKYFRWTQNGKQVWRKAGTRSWAEAHEQKRRLRDLSAGRVP